MQKRVLAEASMSGQSENRFDLTGKVAVILGGTSGIGLAIAEALYRSGAIVIPSSRRRAAVQQAAKLFCRPNVKCIASSVDVCAPASMEHLRDQVLATHG